MILFIRYNSSFVNVHGIEYLVRELHIIHKHFHQISGKEHTEAFNAFRATPSWNPNETKVSTLPSSTAKDSFFRDSLEIGSSISAEGKIKSIQTLQNVPIHTNKNMRPNTWIIHVRQQPRHCFLNTSIGGINSSFLTMEKIKSHACKLSNNILICNNSDRFQLLTPRTCQHIITEEGSEYFKLLDWPSSTRIEPRKLLNINYLFQEAALLLTESLCCACDWYQ